jgi:hypothetical protein
MTNAPIRRNQPEHVRGQLLLWARQSKLHIFGNTFEPALERLRNQYHAFEINIKCAFTDTPWAICAPLWGVPFRGFLLMNFAERQRDRMWGSLDRNFTIKSF